MSINNLKKEEKFEIIREMVGLHLLDVTKAVDALAASEEEVVELIKHSAYCLAEGAGIVAGGAVALTDMPMDEKISAAMMVAAQGVTDGVSKGLEVKIEAEILHPQQADLSDKVAH